MPRSNVYICLCLLIIVSTVQASYFQPCYYNVDYKVKIQRVNVFLQPSSRQQGVVSIRYKAYSDVRIPKGRVKVDTFLTTETPRKREEEDEQPHNYASHQFCSDTECAIERGDRFDAEFRLNLPWNSYGSMTLLMRLVDQVNGRELTCITVDFDVYDRTGLEAI